MHDLPAVNYSNCCKFYDVVFLRSAKSAMAKAISGHIARQKELWP